MDNQWNNDKKQPPSRGSFTLPGEAGYEELTLHLAEKWGADVIRDSDGTSLSDEILDAGYGVYSTICIIRDHNEWIRHHPECRQQSFLMAGPVTAEKDGTALNYDGTPSHEGNGIPKITGAIRNWLTKNLWKVPG